MKYELLMIMPQLKCEKYLKRGPCEGVLENNMFFYGIGELTVNETQLSEMVQKFN